MWWSLPMKLCPEALRLLSLAVGRPDDRRDQKQDLEVVGLAAENGSLDALYPRVARASARRCTHVFFLR